MLKRLQIIALNIDAKGVLEEAVGKKTACMIDELSFSLWLCGNFNLYDLSYCNFNLSATTLSVSFQYTIPIELIGAKPTTRFAIMDAHCCSYGYLQLAPSSAVSPKWLPMNDPGLFVRAGRLHFGSGSLARSYFYAYALHRPLYPSCDYSRQISVGLECM